MDTFSHWQGTLVRCGVIRRTGKNKTVHFRLTSYKHSDLYVNMRKLESFPRMFEVACADLIAKAIRETNMCIATEIKNRTVWFIGPEKGGVKLAHECGRQLRTCAGYAEKDGGGMRLKCFDVKTGESVFVVDDVVTTGTSITKTMEAVREVGGIIQSPILTLCNRSQAESLAGIPIISLISLKGNVWEAAACPLCEEGSVVCEHPRGLFSDVT